MKAKIIIFCPIIYKVRQPFFKENEVVFCTLFHIFLCPLNSNNGFFIISALKECFTPRQYLFLFEVLYTPKKLFCNFSNNGRAYAVTAYFSLKNLCWLRTFSSSRLFLSSERMSARISIVFKIVNMLWEKAKFIQIFQCGRIHGIASKISEKVWSFCTTVTSLPNGREGIPHYPSSLAPAIQHSVEIFFDSWREKNQESFLSFR